MSTALRGHKYNYPLLQQQKNLVEIPGNYSQDFVDAGHLTAEL